MTKETELFLKNKLKELDVWFIEERRIKNEIL